ncbi:hypothetical protein HDU82_005054 [Entophlyctis luteolus]|nr:hypothetical protein HDU82_005054 [Entophlyctis luteolus]
MAKSETRNSDWQLNVKQIVSNRRDGQFGAAWLPNHSVSVSRRASTGVAGCGSTKQFVFMGAAADCTYVNSYGGTAKALAQILADFNSASAVYESSFNVGLAIIKVNLMTTCSSAGAVGNNSASLSWNQACSDTYGISNRLRLEVNFAFNSLR